MTTWAEAHHGTFHLHGHSHGMLTDQRPRRMDVGVDPTGKGEARRWGTPLSAEEVLEKLAGEEYVAVDHHNL
jgi:calcineurin-like phosphoesterase family protein